MISIFDKWIVVVAIVQVSSVGANLTFDADGNLLDDGLAEILSRPRSQTGKNAEKSDRVTEMRNENNTSNEISNQEKRSNRTTEEKKKIENLDEKGSSKDDVKKDTKNKAEKSLLELGSEIQAKNGTKYVKVRVKKTLKTGKVVKTQRLFSASKFSKSSSSSTSSSSKSTTSMRKGVDPPIAKTFPAGDATILDTNSGTLNKLRDQKFQLKTSRVAGIGDNAETLTYYPWESLSCEDFDPVACEKFKPFCEILEVTAFQKCPMTCGVCKNDHHSNKVFGVEFPILQGSVTFTQTSLSAPVFMTACFTKKVAAKLQLESRTHSLVIHSYGEVGNEGKSCENIGPHFNPFGVAHGDPDESTRHLGDLGNLDFDQVPDDWPKGIKTCDLVEVGAYGMFDQLTLFGDHSPLRRPIVLYAGNSPYQDYSPNDAVSCGIITEMKSQKNILKGNAETPNLPHLNSLKVQDSVLSKIQNLPESVQDKTAKVQVMGGSPIFKGPDNFAQSS